MHQRLCHWDDIEEGQSKGFNHLPEPIVAIKKQGKLCVYINRCPHLGVPLEWQTDQFLNHDNSLIQCATHGAMFTIQQGYCITGPCEGSYLESVETLIQGEEVLVYLENSD